MKRRLLFLLVFAFIFLPLSIHAENGTTIDKTVVNSVDITFSRNQFLDKNTVKEFNQSLVASSTTSTEGLTILGGSNSSIYQYNGEWLFTLLSYESTETLGTEREFAFLYSIQADATHTFPDSVKALGSNSDAAITDVSGFSVSFNGVNSTDAHIGYSSSWNCVMVYIPVGHADSSHEVFFNTNGGQSVNRMVVRDGGYIPAENLPEPTREGYRFLEWYTDEGLAHLFEPEVAITADMTLYAKWQPVVNSVELTGTVTEPKIGDNIVNPSVSIYSVNGDPTLRGLGELDLEWQYKSDLDADEWHGWSTAAGKFEVNKIYRLTLVFRKTNAEYEMASIPEIPVKLNDNKLTQFQINNQTVGVIIKYPELKNIVVNNITLSGIVQPVEGESPNFGITTSTPGLNIHSIEWFESDKIESEPLNSTFKYVAKTKYHVRLRIDVLTGYELKEGFGGTADLIYNGMKEMDRREIVTEPFDPENPGFDVYVYYEATEKQNTGGEGNSTIVDPTPVDPTPVVVELVTPVINVTKGPNNTLYINWQANPGATRFEVYRSTNKKKWTKFISNDATSYEQLKLTYGTTYYYKVKACDDTKCTGYSNIASKRVVPDTVQNLKVDKAGAKSIKVSWEKVGVTGYEVQRSTNKKKWSKVKTISKNGTLNFNNTKLKSATKYYYRVRAYKTVKGKKIYGGWSNVVDAVTGPATPKKPTIKSPNFETITLNLKSTKTATYYEVQRSTNKKNGFGTIGILKTLQFTDTVPTGKTFYYRVRACNDADVCSGWTSVVSKKATLGKPGVQLVLSEQGIVTLKTKTVNGAHDYEVQRSTNKKKGYKTFYYTSDDSLFINEVASKKTYYYRVRAIRYVDGKKVYSSWSNILTVKSKKIDKNDKRAAANKTAKVYLSALVMSKKGLIEQLEYQGFDHDLSTEVVEALPVDWNEEAMYMAMILLQGNDYTFDEMVEALEVYEGFTHEEAVYGATNCGAF